MRLKDLPQDKSAISDISRELNYVVDETGQYRVELSTGWEVKASALDNAWEEINEQAAYAEQQMREGRVSPIYYYMVKNIMDISLLKDYTGFLKISIRRHFKPKVFNRLSDKKLKIYAEVFNVNLGELKKFKSDAK